MIAAIAAMLGAAAVPVPARAVLRSPTVRRVTGSITLQSVANIPIGTVLTVGFGGDDSEVVRVTAINGNACAIQVVQIKLEET